jgi:DNA invertase Pin-like site-specific DNA recombinase
MDKPSPPSARPLRWVSWTAVSSEEQAEKISLEQQAADSEAAVDRHGGLLVARLQVPGHTRYYALYEDAERDVPAYADLRRLIARRSFDVLVFRDISRLGRTAALIMNVVELCRQAGIALYPTADPPRTIEVQSGHGAMLQNAILSVGAQDEVHRLRERHRFGMIGRVKEGKLPGKPTFGYKVTYDAKGKAHVVIDEPAAAVVRLIFDLYLAGMGTPQIADRLRELDLPSITGIPWKTKSAAHVVEHALRYAGYNELNRRSGEGRPYLCVRGEWEPIISEETLARVRAEQAQRAKSRKIANTVHRYSGVCLCEDCGAVMVSVSATGTVRCTRHIPNNAIRYQAIDAALDAAFADLDLEALDTGEDDDAAALHGRLAALAVERARVDAAMQRADDLHLDGDMDEDRYRRQLKRLAGQRRAVEVEETRTRQLLAAAAERGTRRDRLESVAAIGRAMLHHEDATAANVWLRRHIRVRIGAGQVSEIEFL